jgi:hypothetical protein
VEELMPSKRRKKAPQPEPIEVEVCAVTNFAFNAGLTVELAERLLIEADDLDCRVRSGRCPGSCNGAESSLLIALRVFDGRDVIYCEGCGVADLWV